MSGLHRLTPAALDDASRLMAFNWLTASYAHRDWLGPWAELLEPRERAGMGLMRRASMVLLERHGLRDRYLRSADGHPWLLLSTQALEPLAEELGVAMLGGWVRNGLEREQVARQLRVLGPQRRDRALIYASRLQALPFGGPQGDWPLQMLGSASVVELGLSCMAALLASNGVDDSGAEQRFKLRFARGLIVPLPLSRAQRDEATALLAELMQGQEAQP